VSLVRVPLLVLLVLGLSSPPPGLAQVQPSSASGAAERLTLAAALSEALDKNLDLIAKRAGLTIADANVLTARLRPNPVLSLGGDHLDFLGTGFDEENGAGPPENSARIDFLFELGGKRARRTDVAREERGVRRSPARAAEPGPRARERGGAQRSRHAQPDSRQERRPRGSRTAPQPHCGPPGAAGRSQRGAEGHYSAPAPRTCDRPGTWNRGLRDRGAPSARGDQRERYRSAGTRPSHSPRSSVAAAGAGAVASRDPPATRARTDRFHRRRRVFAVSKGWRARGTPSAYS
jgi:hypothetical protein